MSEKYELDQVSVRLVREAPLLSEEKINTPEDAIRILGDAFKDYDREVVGVVHLRSDNAPINMTIVSMGCLNQSIVHPRELLKAAFLSNAAAIMMFHNHPSGSLQPSREDIAITNRMQQLCMMAGIPVLDHIILGQNDFYYSFREKDILPMDEIRYSSELSDVDLKVAEKEATKYGYRKTEASRPKKSIKASLAEKKKLTQAGAQRSSGKKRTKEPEH
ncbi:MAG: JAB domain-containing protein [Eubacteriales bacterium]|nr:JAB domain-containing protein [Eubacteriales bacterium]